MSGQPVSPIEEELFWRLQLERQTPEIVGADIFQPEQGIEMEYTRHD